MTTRPRPARRRSSPARRSSYLWIAAGVLAVAAFVALLVTAATRERLPRIGDHWHARYSVVICGEALPPLPLTPGNVHTHGDALIHIHPGGPGEAGRNANLARFFSSAGIELSRERIVFPDGRSYANGDACPDGTPGTLRVLVNGRPVEALEQHVPKDGETIVVSFGAQ